ncbi:MAG: asparagine synthase (glutamine-hydrolyzing), partial [Acidobacteriota bacterium]
MCGIAGIVDFRGQFTAESVGQMVTTLDYRGPDARCLETISERPFVGLGHTRLKVVDLTDRANQPMYS